MPRCMHGHEGFSVWRIQGFEIVFYKFVSDCDVVAAHDEMRWHIEPWHLVKKINRGNNVIPETSFRKAFPKGNLIQIDLRIDRR